VMGVDVLYDLRAVSYHITVQATLNHYLLRDNSDISPYETVYVFPSLKT
jgi:hypothetical protein